MTDLLQGTPTESPPGGAEVTAAAGSSGPTLVEPEVAQAAATEAGPTLTAPGVREAGGVTAATWRTGQVTALWSIDETRNAWMLVSGVGWRKLFNGRDGAFTALVVLASQARQTGRTINFREEADGMVYEIYLW